MGNLTEGSGVLVADGVVVGLRLVVTAFVPEDASLVARR